MKQQFHFSNPDSFRSRESSLFAQHLLQAPASIRTRLKTGFGVSLDVSSDPIRITHDGQRIGIGAFVNEGNEIQFSIGPKVGFRVIDLIEAMKGSRYWGNLVGYGNRISSTSVEEGYSDFTPAHLISLLYEISSYASRHVDITHRRRREPTGWRVRGRILINESIRKLVGGRLDGLTCEVYDDRAFQDYAEVLCATAEDINDALVRWRDMVIPIESEISNALRQILARFGHLRGPGFSMLTLMRACRPPFPLGLRNLLYQCMRYWQWRGQIRMAQDKDLSHGYWELMLRLDDLFEAYVGETWAHALDVDYKWLASQEYHYRMEPCRGEPARTIRPDHCFRHNMGDVMLVVDAKYRVDIGSEEQIYQMIAYLDYHYPDRDAFRRLIGILVYPGTEWDMRWVTTFGQLICCITMPIVKGDTAPSIRKMLDSILLLRAG